MNDKGDLIFDIACGTTMVLLSLALLVIVVTGLVAIIKG